MECKEVCEMDLLDHHDADTDQSDEELFLSSYHIEDYDRPSVATDIAAFTINTREESYRHNPEPNLSLLLIRRGEHPFLNAWALPGGFLRPDETVEECAYREITEETNIRPVSLMPVGVFSETDRDPRGRIISNAYASIISSEDAGEIGGYDAIDAKWFDVSFEEEEKGKYTLTLSNEDIILSAELQEKEKRFGRYKFEIIRNEGLAFDHAKMIAAAIASLREEAKNLDVVFDFLPEKFTLAALQKVQETLMNATLVPANFRRKIADYVVETDEYTEGAGHRPARLYMRKDEN